MKTYFIKDAHGPHYEWLMEKTKNLVEYAKREDYKKVAAFCENILEGLRNNKLVDSKLKDVRLEKGDWFVNKNDAMHADSLKLYKVIDDRNLSTNGFAKAMICEKYVARRNDDDDTYKFTIRKDGRETIHYDTYLKQNAVKFNSAEEALNWLRRQVKIRNTNKL